MNNTLVLVKGCSGTGKSTRTSFLIEKLKERGFSSLPPLNYDGKPVCLNIVDPLSNLTYKIFGKYTKTGKWQGFDIVTKYFPSSEVITQFVIETFSNNDGQILIIEGASTTLSWRWRPIYLSQLDQTYQLFTYCVIIYYQFQKDGFDSYVSRILERSNKLVKNSVMWEKNKYFLNEYKKTLLELEQLTEGQRSKFFVNEFYYNEPIDHLYNYLFPLDKLADLNTGCKKALFK